MAKWTEIDIYTGLVKKVDEDVPANFAGQGSKVALPPDAQMKKKKKLLDARTKVYRQHRERLEKLRAQREAKRKSMKEHKGTTPHKHPHEDDEIDEGKMKELAMKIADVYTKMKKDRTMKPFADKFRQDVKKSLDIRKSLEKVLPDYVSGGSITKLMAGYENYGEEVELEEKLSRKDQNVIDAFYIGNKADGNILSTDGKTLEKGGMGAQTIATRDSVGSKFKIVAKMDGRSTQEIVKYIKKSFPKDVVSEEVDLDEGRMKELHMYIGQGKSAEWIAKKMKLDVKTVKALMSEGTLTEKSAKYLELEFKDKRTAENAWKYINHKLEPGGRQPWYDFNQEGNSLQFEKMDDADKLMKELKKKFKFKVYEREEVVKEGTWHIAKNYSQLKRAMKKPMKKNPIDAENEKIIYKHIGDDELHDDIARLKNGEDMRPAVQKAMKRLGMKEEMSFAEKIQEQIGEFGKESLLAENNMEVLKSIVKSKSAKNIKMKDGNLKMDMFTASAIMNIYDKVNPSNKKKIEALANGKKADIMKLQKMAMKLAGRK